MAELPDLSDELLLIIFSLSTLHSTSFPPTHGSRSAFSRCLAHKTTLVQVCKRWNILATQLLYSNVVLRRYGQYVSLLHTLIASLLGTHIVTLTFSSTFYVPEELEELFEMTLGAFMKLCPRLRDIKMLSYTLIPRLMNNVTLTPNITSLAFDRYFLLKDVEQVLISAIDNLTSLQVALCGADKPTALSFPSLETLHCILDFDTYDHSPLTVLLAWEFPALTELHLQRDIFRHPLQFYEGITAVCKQSGQKIRYFTLTGFQVDMNLFNILRELPELEHLGLDSIYPKVYDSDNSLRLEVFPTVKVLDLFDAGSNLSWPEMRNEFHEYFAWLPNLELFRRFRLPTRSLFSRPFPSKVNPVHVMQESLSWVQPTNPQVSCRYLSSQLRPSQYHSEEITLFTVDDEEETDIEDYGYASSSDASSEGTGSVSSCESETSFGDDEDEDEDEDEDDEDEESGDEEEDDEDAEASDEDIEEINEEEAREDGDGEGLSIIAEESVYVGNSFQSADDGNYGTAIVTTAHTYTR